MREGVFLKVMKRELPPARTAAAKSGGAARVILPPYAPGMRIGLFGGTFDPAHAAHRAACLLAMQRLGLDRVWWLVTPGNPLKDTRGLAPLAKRVAAARRLGASSAHRRHRPRSQAGHPLQLRDDLLSGPPLRRRAFRLDHGRRQFAQLPSLAALARYRRDGADSGRRPPRSKPLCNRQCGRPLAGALPHCPNRPQGRWRNESRQPGFTCMASNRRFPRQHCGRHGPCKAVETLNRACLS